MRLGIPSLLALSIMASLTSAASVTYAKGKPVVISAPWEITSVDPAVSGFALQKLQVLENLVDATTDGVLRPGLATDWSASEDGLVWRFSLREDVSFHDGTPFNSEVAATAIQRAASQPGILKKAPITKVEADGDALVIKLEKPFAALPALLTHATTIILAPSSFNDEGRPVKAIGTGPFEVETFSPPLGLDVVRYDGYWGKAPSIEAAKYLASSRAETRALLAESGDANLVFTLDPSGFSRLKNVDAVEVQAVPIPRVVALKVNAGHPFFSAPEARQALSLAIDREGIAAGITRFPDAFATQLFPPVLDGWHDESLTPLAFDPEKAKGLLADLGWKPAADGILEKDGKRFSILLRTFPDRPELPLMATALQDQWREIGVELEVSVSSFSEIPAGHQDGSLHVALYARNYGLTPDPIGSVLQDFASGGGDWGAMNWDAPAVTEALETIAENENKTTRAPLIAKATKAIHEGLPVIPLVWYQHTVAISNDLEGVIVDPSQRTYGLNLMSWK